MNRTQFLAALAVVVVIGALVATRFRSDSSTDAAAPAQDTSAQSSEGAETDGDTAESGQDGTDDGQAAEAEAPTTVTVIDPPPILEAKPTLTNIDGWINTDASSLDDFAGQVRVVEFWTFGCFNCKNRIPHTQELYAQYKDQGLEIIGIHSPEFERERDPEAVLEATERLGVTWPVALDTEKTNFRAWQGNRRFWPRVYVFDQNGDLRYDHIGEGDYDGLTELVGYLIENGP
ncbi:MAG: redoxin domain-containing protein [Actinomycetota bacterium]